VQPGLLRRAAHLAPAQDAEDLVQVTYLKAVTLLDNYDLGTGTLGMEKWLHSILNRVCQKHRHRTNHRDELLLGPSTLTEIIDAHLDTATADSDDSLVLTEIEPHLQIRSLTGRRSEIYALWRKGHSQPEIAGALGLTQQGVSYHIGRILDQLRAAAGDLITRADGYPSTIAMFNAHARVTIYRRPQRRGTVNANRKLERLR
jgi:RNA polymerase sigma factor (sigma-70 family)